jgi:hypothetical protein
MSTTEQPDRPIPPTVVDLDVLRIPDDPLVGSLKLPVVVRRPHEQDIPFVFDGWLRSYRSAKSVCQVPNETYYFWHHRLVEGFWFDRTCTWLVACNPTTPTQVFGFLCGQMAETLAGNQPVLHYCYVAKNFRRWGLASRLAATFGAAAGVVTVTHQTDASKAWFKAIGVAPLYNPYLAFGRSPVPQPQLKGYGGRRSRRHRDPVVTSRRALTAGGYVPGSAQEDEETT